MEKLAGLRVGLVTDMHYADKPSAGSRHYRLTLQKLREAAGEFSKAPIDMLVELGDFIDAAETVEVELGYLKKIQSEFELLAKERHYVLGNHCVDTLTKKEFLAEVGQERSFYSFDREGTHFVVIDSCFRSDGVGYERKNFHWTDANVPQHQLDWLKEDLRSTNLPTIVFAHQRLDPSGSHEVKNAAAVRTIFEESGKVKLVLQGHSHQNDLQDIRGIHYCTLVAMVEGSGPEQNGYSVLEILEGPVYKITGYRKQKGYLWEPTV